MYDEANKGTFPSRQYNRRVSKRASTVWDHFNRTEEGGEVRVAFIYYGKTYAYNSKYHETNNL